MQRKSLTLALAIAGTVGLVTAVPGFAQDTGGSTNSRTGSGAAARTATTPHSETRPMADTPSIRNDSTMSTPRMNQDKSDLAPRGQSSDLEGQDAWADRHAEQNNGRISREDYMHEMSRRWDAMDPNHRGLTPAEVGHLYGSVDSAADPVHTGSGMRTGNMRPGTPKAE